MRRVVLLSVLVLAGCGSGGDETALLGPVEASRLDRQVELVDERVAAGDCDGARRALSQYAQLVDRLPDRRDAALRRELRDGATQLEGTITADCEPAAEEPATTATTTTSEPAPTTTATEPETTTTTTTTTEPEPAPEPTTTAPAPTPAPTPTPTVPAPVEPDPGGGEEDGQGQGQGGDAGGSEGSGGAGVPEDEG